MGEGAQAGAGLAGKLASYPGPAYRKAYLKNLLESGSCFLSAGNARGAEYCFAKVAEALRGQPASGLDGSPDSASEEGAENAQDSGSAAASPEDSAAAVPVERKPRAPRAKPKEKPLSATERVRRQWRLERIKDAETVLFKHAGRLSELESQSYRERLEKLRQSGQAASTAAQSDKADAGLLELRRRLYRRVLKSQRLSLSRQRMPVTLARLALPPSGLQSGSRALVPGSAGKGPAKPGAQSKVRVDTEWQPVVGPYNDRYNMEDLLSLVADADASWVQEFLDLYRGLAGMQELVTALAAAKK